jgi:hypothetical protein
VPPGTSLKTSPVTLNVVATRAADGVVSQPTQSTMTPTPTNNGQC